MVIIMLMLYIIDVVIIIIVGPYHIVGKPVVAASMLCILTHMCKWLLCVLQLVVNGRGEIFCCWPANKPAAYLWSYMPTTAALRSPQYLKQYVEWLQPIPKFEIIDFSKVTYTVSSRSSITIICYPCYVLLCWQMLACRQAISLSCITGHFLCHIRAHFTIYHRNV